jgi:hypothetical protein
MACAMIGVSGGIRSIAHEEGCAMNGATCVRSIAQT